MMILHHTYREICLHSLAASTVRDWARAAVATKSYPYKQKMIKYLI
ncbi:BgTH12-03747 [Blumeria graminis f. sp. triticale]|uniref:BgTH12-03747 n=1 Tax=Blumeria graminis f. sp. triticale TaxID=1689686 RepID=A0A9W4D0C8_BLUGR|nr:BgTH12-03747 [Blumeria graminis f. sp. triticale]